VLLRLISVKLPVGLLLVRMSKKKCDEAGGAAGGVVLAVREIIKDAA